MSKIILSNDFHNTRTEIRSGAYGFISLRAAKRAERKLCGMADCKCGGMMGIRGTQRQPDGTMIVIIDYPFGAAPGYYVSLVND